MNKKRKIQFHFTKYNSDSKENILRDKGTGQSYTELNDKDNEGKIEFGVEKEIDNFFSTIKSNESSLQTGKNFEDFYNKIEFVEKTTIKPQNLHKGRRFLLKVAAVLVPIAIMASLTFSYLRNKEITNYEVISTLKGSKTKIILEDGTKIWLNSESELKYPSTFRGKDKRIVNLVGEAYFDVTKNEKKPFEVYAAGYKFKVLGTAFNIKAYPGENRMQTTLEHGKVNVEKIISEKNNESRKIISLKPKQTIVIYMDSTTAEYSDLSIQESIKSVNNIKSGEPENKSALLIDNEDLSPYVGWKDNKLVFSDVSIGEMVNDLERWYNINVVIADDDIKDIKFTAIFTTETAEQAIKAISFATNIGYEINNNTVILKIINN